MNDHTLRVYDSILGLRCDAENPTPLVRLNRVSPFRHTTVYAKLEWYNPFGAVKDRIAANLIADAEERVNRMLQQSDNESRSRRTDADAYALRSLRALERQLHEISGSVRKGIDMLSQETTAVNGSIRRADD